MIWAKTIFGLLLFSSPSMAQDLSEERARQLLDQTDDMHRGQSSYSKLSMSVKTERWERTLSIEAWSQGEEKSLMKILSPAKEAGTATLKVDDNIWNYLPKVDRTMKVPSSMMSGSWMGSHFTNDDLVKESRMADDFTYSMSLNDTGNYIIECLAKEDAAVVWGKVVVKLTSDELPQEIQYYSERMELKRTMIFSDIREMDGKKIPFRMKLIPNDKPAEYTEIFYDELKFGIEIPESTFTVQALK